MKFHIHAVSILTVKRSCTVLKQSRAAAAARCTVAVEYSEDQIFISFVKHFQNYLINFCCDIHNKRLTKIFVDVFTRELMSNLFSR